MPKIVKKNLLVVDDNEAILEVVKIALESEGYAVDTACGGEEMKQKLKKHMLN